MKRSKFGAFGRGRTSNSLMDVFMVSHFKYDTLLEKFVRFGRIRD